MWVLGKRVLMFPVLHHGLGNGADIQEVTDRRFSSTPQLFLLSLRQLLLHTSQLSLALPRSLQLHFAHQRQVAGTTSHQMVERLEDVPAVDLETTWDSYIIKKSMTKSGKHVQPFLSTLKALEKESRKDPTLGDENVIQGEQEISAFAPLFRLLMTLFEGQILEYGDPILNLETEGALDRWIENHYREEVKGHVASCGSDNHFGLLDMVHAEHLLAADYPFCKEDYERAYSQLCHDIDSGELTANLQWFIAEVYLPIIAYSTHGYFCYSYMHWARAIGSAFAVDVQGVSKHSAVVCPWKIKAPACTKSRAAVDLESKVSTWRLESTLNASSLRELPSREQQLVVAAPTIPVNLFLDYFGHLEFALKVMRQAISHDRSVLGEVASSKKIFPVGFKYFPWMPDLPPEHNSLLAFRSLQLQLDKGSALWPWVVAGDQSPQIYRLPKAESWSYILSGAQVVEWVWESLIQSSSVWGVMLVAPLWFPKADANASRLQLNHLHRQSAFVPVMPVSLHRNEFEIILPSTGLRGGSVSYKVLKGLRPLSVGERLKDWPKYTLRDADIEVNAFLKNSGFPGYNLQCILEASDWRGADLKRATGDGRSKRWRGVDLNELERWALELANSWSDSLTKSDSASAEQRWAETVNEWFPGMAMAMGIDFDNNLKDYTASTRRVSETFLLLRFVAGIALDKWVSERNHQMSNWYCDSPLIFIGDILDGS